LQMASRAATPHPGKNYYTLLDFGRNHDRHGLVHESRTWDLNPPRKKKKQGIAPVRECPKCGAMLPASSIKCPFCGQEFPRQEEKLKTGVMVEVKAKVKEIPAELKGRLVSSLSVAQLVAVSKSGAISKPYVWRVVRSKGTQAVRDYSWAMGYQEGFVFAQIKEIDDNRYKDKAL